MPPFRVLSDFEPSGDQPKAIEGLAEGVLAGENYATLMGITGSGKTFTVAKMIERVARPTLVISPNKSLAAQLANEFREFFPDNSVEYFVSYYDYYQPEAYVPQTDTYIEKDATINDEIERLRHSATAALLTRKDVVIVASVSCIYGLGTPEEYMGQVLRVIKGVPLDRDFVLERLTGIQYQRTTQNLARGKFRSRGDTIEIHPAYEETLIRVELWGDEVERITRIDPITGEVLEELNEAWVYPATHYVASHDRMARAIEGIERELADRLQTLESQNKLLEAQRLRMRTNHDLEMLRELGFCSGIENYSRHIDGRQPGEPPYTLVEHGFRLPSAVDNRPLEFEEFIERVDQIVFMSATPGPYELQVSKRLVEQIVRPTGLVDPKVEVRPTRGQVDDLIEEIRRRAERDERVLVTTLTKKMAEDLTDYLIEMGLRVRYLHSEVDTIQRIEILRDLRLGEFDVLVGINLLREGLDLPEVSLVAILDADKEGFLRSETSLIQTIGRAARNVDGTVIMYADEITDSMRRAVSETERRRRIQVEYNREHGIDPTTIRKKVSDILLAMEGERLGAPKPQRRRRPADRPEMPREELERLIQTLGEEMHEAAKDLRFEYAARLRDEVRDLRRELSALDRAGVR